MVVTRPAQEAERALNDFFLLLERSDSLISRDRFPRKRDFERPHARPPAREEGCLIAAS